LAIDPKPKRGLDLSRMKLIKPKRSEALELVGKCGDQAGKN